ncbi:MAG TPA: hypothetical protein VH640_10585 [Bryobacteraceae bacterium]|jgi:hypothetical protein
MLLSNIARVAVVLWCLSLYGQTAESPAPGSIEAAWKPLRFLIGTWEAKVISGAAAAAGVGTYTFQLELGGHILARHSATLDCKGPDNFNCQHTDLLYIYRESPAQSPQAIYFDDEGHVIHYEVTTPAPGTVVLVSASSASGPQYRLVYELKEGVMQGKFQLRMPGQSRFASYLEWSGRKK